MQPKIIVRFLAALTLALFITHVGFGQTASQKVYSEVMYHKLKPGHTMAEARAYENEFKKVHQVQADEGSILGWYMLALDMTTNPNKEYSYITIKNVSDPGYFDNSYPEAAMKKGWGDYQKKITELSKQGREVTETAKVEIWENLDITFVNPMPSPGKSPVWGVRFIKVKDNQYEAYINHVKKGKPFNQAMLDAGGGVVISLARLLYPAASEKPYEFASVIQLQNMKIMFDDFQEEAVFKKTMPGVDSKQYYQQFNSLRDRIREEFYYLQTYAVKTPASKLAIQLDPAKLDAYVGVYEGPFRDNPKATFTVTREGNQLYEELTGGQNLAILPQSETKFVFREMDAQLEFIKDGSGKVVKRTLTYDGKTTEARKIK